MRVHIDMTKSRVLHWCLY